MTDDHLPAPLLGILGVHDARRDKSQPARVEVQTARVDTLRALVQMLTQVDVRRDRAQLAGIDYQGRPFLAFLDATGLRITTVDEPATLTYPCLIMVGRRV